MELNGTYSCTHYAWWSVLQWDAIKTDHEMAPSIAQWELLATNCSMQSQEIASAVERGTCTYQWLLSRGHRHGTHGGINHTVEREGRREGKREGGRERVGGREGGRGREGVVGTKAAEWFHD